MEIAFQWSYLVERKILSKMRGRRAFYDHPSKSYEHSKNQKIVKNCQKYKKIIEKMIFWVFGMFITFRRMVVESSPTSHFTQNFALYKVGSLESNFHQDLLYLKTMCFNTLEKGFLRNLKRFFTWAHDKNLFWFRKNWGILRNHFRKVIIKVP